MAESTIKKDVHIKTETKSGTTNNGGNFYIGNDDGWSLVSAMATGSLNRMFIPFKTDGSIYLKVLDWNTNNYQPVVNGAVSVSLTWVK